MTTLLAVRHAEHTLQDRVMVGRTPGVSLSDAGRTQAAETAGRLARLPLACVLTSPRRRARQTAAAIVAASGAPCEIDERLDELDLGEWTGRTLKELATDPQWQRWNIQRAVSRCPGGESMTDVWKRVSDALAAMHGRWPSGTVAFVSHAEPIRAAILSATGRSFDHFGAVDIAPASVTALSWNDGRLHIAPVDQGIAA